ncbi:MAG: hypothetical protein B7Z33_11510 [Sphingomonadales bacterium 12-68-11]|nr:MAG: hypothetical protein B7Z33_11510 [Sphingomonadales bacterium 12-68-11]
MKLVRTLAWLLLLAVLLVFSVANWGPPVTVRIWENLVVETQLPAIVILSLAIGFVPMWLYHRAVRWRMQRRILSLEAAARAAAVPPPTDPEQPEALKLDAQPIAPAP